MHLQSAAHAQQVLVDSMGGLSDEPEQQAAPSKFYCQVCNIDMGTESVSISSVMSKV